jgi:LmbE family N-acetylglucosaminyl deacetylase
MNTRISRRNLIARAALLGTSLAAIGPGLAEPAVQTTPQGRNQTDRLKIVVTGGHPGDPEYGCGGTAARLADLGHEVVLLYLNRGDPSQRPGEPAKELRTREAEKACSLLSARPVFAEQIDGHAIVDSTHENEFRRLLEVEQPAVVFTHWPIDNHADHRAISMLVYGSWLALKRSFALYYYEVSNGEDTLQFAPTHYVDITSTEPKKRAACYAHASQAPDRYYALQQAVARWRGIESGHTQAEAFIRHVQSPTANIPLLS